MAIKRLGQNFLFDESILRRLVAVSGIEDTDLVVEIGPGHGRLTAMLLEKASSVIAIELDSRLAGLLKDRYHDNGNIEIIEGDAMRYNYNSLPHFKVVANIPYYITTPLIFRLLEARDKLISMTLTIQKEVAERIAAGPGGRDYGALSVAVQYYGRPHIEFLIPKEAFHPTPKVDSAVIKIEIYKGPPVQCGDERIFFRLVRATFSQRRKTLNNSLKSLFPNIREMLEESGIAGTRRAETLSLEEFASLSRVIQSKMTQQP